jgi:hypothetical protein
VGDSSALRLERSCGQQMSFFAGRALGTPALAGKLARGKPDQPAKMAGEMALVGESGSCSDVRKRHLFAHPLLGPVDPDLRLVGVGRNTCFSGEHAMQMKRAQVGDAGQIVERDGIGKMLVNERSYTSHRRALASRMNLRGTCSRTANDQMAHKIEARFVALQAAVRRFHDGVHAQETLVRGKMVDFEAGEIRRGQIASGNLVRKPPEQLDVNV